MRAARQPTSIIPIVMIAVGDSVGVWFVASLARPGGIVTGLTDIAPDLEGKQLELLEVAHDVE